MIRCLLAAATLSFYIGFGMRKPAILNMERFRYRSVLIVIER